MTPAAKPATARESAIVTAYVVTGETLQQIGDAHGISRERVRQILAKFGIDRRNAPKRAGDEILKHGDLRYRYGWSCRSVCVWRAHLAYKTTRREQVAALRAWVAETGRTDPTTVELLQITGAKSVVRLASIWGRRVYGRRNQPYTPYLNRIRRLGGVVVRPRGTPGHLAGALRRAYTRTPEDLARDAAIAEAFKDASAIAVGAQFGISDRAVYRAVDRHRRREAA